jgi:hypothetical protein
MNYVQNKIERLQNGEIIVSREPGNSMEPILKSREPVILVPIKDEEELYSLEEGDIVFAKVHGNCYTHKVYAVDREKGVKIGNNHGHENGWTKQDFAKAHLIPKDKQKTNKDVTSYLEEFIKQYDSHH